MQILTPSELLRLANRAFPQGHDEPEIHAHFWHPAPLDHWKSRQQWRYGAVLTGPVGTLVIVLDGELVVASRPGHLDIPSDGCIAPGSLFSPDEASAMLGKALRALRAVMSRAPSLRWQVVVMDDGQRKHVGEAHIDVTGAVASVVVRRTRPAPDGGDVMAVSVPGCPTTLDEAATAAAARPGGTHA